MANMDAVLGMKPDEIKRPPPTPVGTYTLQILGRPNIVDQSRAQKTDYVDFETKIIAIDDDVSEADLQAFPGGRSALLGSPLKGRAGARFYLSEAALPQLKEWLQETLGCWPDGATLKEAIFSAPGNTVKAVIGQEPSQDGKSMQSRVVGWAKA